MERLEDTRRIMLVKKNESIRILEELSDFVEASFPYRSEALMNIIEALVVGPRITSPLELAGSPQLGYQWSSIYSSIREGTDQESLVKLRDARAEWWEEHREMLYESDEVLKRVGEWRIKILDATDYQRPKTRTVKIGYAHGVDGMKPGHTLSVLSEPTAPGSWCLPLAIAVVEVGKSASEFGACQIKEYIERYGWQPDEILDVDCGYINVPTLRPMHQAGANILGRISGKRVLYQPPPPYSGKGRPRKYGKKIKLNDQRTLPAEDEHEQVTLADGRCFEISRWNDVRMSG